jgi:LysR family glycine cleavage system transcriptional activator
MADILATIPLSAIRVFEAAARLLSFTGAARELGMTQAAVSWQIKALERRLDQPLFRRLTREVALTPSGERLARAASEAMAALRTAVSDISDAGEGVLAITTMQTLAERWLAPRLGAFQVSHPKIAVRVETTGRVVDMARGEADVAIRTGDGTWPGMEAVRLFSTGWTVVGTAEAMASLPVQPTPADLLAAPRVGIPAEWQEWFAAAGVETPDGGPAERIAADNQVLEVAAAMAAGAFALASPIMFAADIAAGRLRQPFDIVAPHARSYWLVYPAERRRVRKIAAFREWIVAAALADPAAQKLG